MNDEKSKQKPSPSEIWDKASVMYNKMAKMEATYTLNQVGAIPMLYGDEVLDCGCGPGRITVPVARLVKSVTAMDCADKMLAFCKENVEMAGLKNVEFKNLDFNEEGFESKIKKHDVVICSRSAGLNDLEKLSKLSRRIVAIVIWANAPSIPQLLNKMFEGCAEEHQGPKGGQVDRKMGYNMMFNAIYDLGYEPNVSIVEDGFTKTFESYDEAYDYLIDLREVKPDKKEMFKVNANKFLTKNDDGTVTYLQETRSAVLWWDVNKVEWK